MAYVIFDAQMCDMSDFDATTERLFQIHTTNYMDSCYILTEGDTLTEDDAELALFRKFGKRGWHMLESIEDVTDVWADYNDWTDYND